MRSVDLQDLTPDLGDVPEHWEIVRLKDAASVQTGLTLGKNYGNIETETHPYLRVANVQVGCVDLKHVKYIDVPAREASGATLQAGDVLMTEGGDIDKLGRGCVWRDEIPGCLHQNHVFAVRCNKQLLEPEFLVGVMASPYYFASPENRWGEFILPHLPSWIAPPDWG